MPLLKRKRVLAAKVEATPGTAEALTNAEGAFNVYDLMIQPSIEVEGREQQGSFAALPGVPGARTGKATFKVDLGWDGTSTIPSWASVFLPACGYVDSSGTLTPRSEAPGSNVKTLTIAAYVDGVKKAIAGAVGNVKFTFPTGKMAYAEFEFTGKWVAPTDVALITPTYPTASPLRFAAGTCLLNSVAQKVSQVQFDAGNQVKLLEDPADATGFSYALITNREPKWTLDPESVLVATSNQDRFGAWLAATEWAFALTLDGPTTSTLAFESDKCQIVNIQEADRERVVVDQLELRVLRNTSADTDVQIIFTEAS